MSRSLPADPAPYFDCHVFVCLNERPEGHPRGSCARKGAVVLRNYMKERAQALNIAKTRINGAQCLDRCELGPTLVIYPEGVWYRYDSKADIDEILQTHLIEGRRVDRLMLQPDQTA